METSYQQLIHDYLDGALSESEERSLFDNLSSNPEWREELAFQMRMHEAMQKDLSMVTIPSSATLSIFSVLGFGPPKKKKRGIISALFSQGNLSKTILGISALLVLLLGGYFLFNNQSAKIAQPLQPTGQKSEPAVAQTIATPPIPAPHANAAPVTKEIPRIASGQEQHKSFRDIGKFSSVDYLTSSKIIGISSGGNIYFSDDGGTLWQTLHSNTSKDLFGIHFRDSANGIIVGASGAILLTADAGKHWVSVSSGTEANLISVRYITADIICACGAQGTILMSTTGGLTWNKLETGSNASLFNIHFENAKNGSIGGEHGILFQTTDGGTTWNQKSN